MSLSWFLLLPLLFPLLLLLLLVLLLLALLLLVLLQLQLQLLLLLLQLHYDNLTLHNQSLSKDCRGFGLSQGGFARPAVPWKEASLASE